MLSRWFEVVSETCGFGTDPRSTSLQASDQEGGCSEPRGFFVTSQWPMGVPKDQGAPI